MPSGHIGLAISFLLISLPLASQQAPDYPTSVATQGAAFFQRSQATLTKGLVIRDVTLTATARRIAGSDDETGTATLQALASGEARVNLSFPSGVRTEIRANSNDGPTGQWIQPDGRSEDAPQHNLYTDPAWFFPPLLMSRTTFSQSVVLTHVASEERDGQSVEHLAMFQQPLGATATVSALVQSLSQTDVYIDSASLLPVAIAFKIHPDKDALRGVPAEVRYSEYRIVNSVQVPFHVQRYVSGVLSLDLQLESVALNTGLVSSVLTAR